MAKFEKPQQTKSIQPTPGEKSPSHTHEGALPTLMTEGQRTEVLAKVRSALPSEAEALEADYQYREAQPMVAEREKSALQRELEQERQWGAHVREKAVGLKEHMSYWVTLWEDEKSKALPGERHISSPEYLADRVLTYLLLK